MPRKPRKSRPRKVLSPAPPSVANTLIGVGLAAFLVLLVVYLFWRHI